MTETNMNGRLGTIGGTLTILMINIRNEELIKTTILAAVGACVSYTVSFLLKQFIQFVNKKR